MGLDAKGMGFGSHLVTTARVRESRGPILALPMGKREQGGESPRFGIFQTLIRAKWWGFPPPGGCFPPLGGFVPHPEMAPGATRAPPAPRAGGCSGRQADTRPLPGSLPSARGREHVPRTEQWEFGVFICNPALTPGPGGE